MQGRLAWRNANERERARKMGITDENKIYQADELARGNVMFIATGVTNGSYLEGVRIYGGRAHTHSIVMRSETGTVREIRATHRLSTKPGYHGPGDRG
jgi:fructose-1,6-bisphosphatase II